MTQGLYSQAILEHGRNPSHFRLMDDYTCACTGHNPLCGDEISIFLKVKNRHIEDISFQGSGCAISIASASMMSESLLNASLNEANLRVNEFRKMLIKKLDPAKEKPQLGKLKELQRIANFPSRTKCAGLAWRTFLGAISQVQ